MANYFLSPSGAGVAPPSGDGAGVAGAASGAGVTLLSVVGVGAGAFFFSAQPRTEMLKAAAKTKVTNFFIRFS
jgi:hypothetical protein